MGSRCGTATDRRGARLENPLRAQTRRRTPVVWLSPLMGRSGLDDRRRTRLVLPDLRGKRHRATGYWRQKAECGIFTAALLTQICECITLFANAARLALAPSFCQSRWEPARSSPGAPAPGDRSNGQAFVSPRPPPGRVHRPASRRRAGACHRAEQQKLISQRRVGSHRARRFR